ncbi:MAG: hypothetical protein LAO55_17545 [Acidobacteriia bacterium]|nr:hypothetical protein [Terriglobia bacterium]
MSDLKQKESYLLSELAGVRSAISGLSKARAALELTELPSNSAKGTFYRNVSIKRGAITFLRSRGEPQGSTEIARALIAGGYRSTSRAFYRTVFNVLAAACAKKSSELVKTDAGFGLREWSRTNSTALRPIVQRKDSISR